jgi:hypothetical protein
MRLFFIQEISCMAARIEKSVGIKSSGFLLLERKGLILG